MPRVPTYDDYQVMPNVAPAGGVGLPTMNPQLTGGRQLQDLGQGMQQAGQAAGGIALDMQDQVNQVRVTDAMNQARAAALKLTFDPQQGYQNLKGDAALTRPNGQALADEYGQKLRDQLSDIAGNLGNDRQRLLFQQQAGGLLTSFTGDVEQHTLREYINYHAETNEGAIKLETNNAKLNWNKPDQIQQSLERVQAANYSMGQLRGDPANLIAANGQALVSNVHREVIQAALENSNPTYALDYFGRNKGQMTADDILRTQGLVNTATWQQASMAAVNAAGGDLQRQMAPTDFDRMVDITLASESGGKRYGPDGNLLTSSAGAKGEMQVLDGTNTNPGFGVKPAQDNSPQERARVGRDYLQAMLQRYGDPAKAWAAYNAGPGKVDAALKAAGPDGDWLAQLPTETENYVTRNLSQLQTPQPTARPQESDFVASALAKLPANAPPQLVKLTREAATQQFAIINKSFNEQRDNAVMDAQRALIQAGGDITQVAPEVLAKVQSIAPDKYDDLIKFGRTISRGENQSDPATYTVLASNPGLMAKMGDADFLMLRNKLSNADFEHFARERADMLTGTSKNSPMVIDTEALNDVLNNRLLSIGIDPRPSSEADKQRIGEIQKFVRDAIYIRQGQSGQKMTPVELEQFIDQQFAKSITFRNTVFGVDTTKETVPLLGMKIGDVPAADRQAVRDALLQRGWAAPTDQDILNVYWRWKARGGPQPPVQPGG
jgi:soluble lytic murein transglycosylase